MEAIQHFINDIMQSANNEMLMKGKLAVAAESNDIKNCTHHFRNQLSNQ